jgi:hypothetical protein
MPYIKLDPIKESIIEALSSTSDTDERTHTMSIWINEQSHNVRAFLLSRWVSPQAVMEATCNLVPPEYLYNINWSQVYFGCAPEMTYH